MWFWGYLELYGSPQWAAKLKNGGTWPDFARWHRGHSRHLSGRNEVCEHITKKSAHLNEISCVNLVPWGT